MSRETFTPAFDADMPATLEPTPECMLMREEQPQPPPLTPREIECTRWAAEGKTDHEAARIIGISERTARFHIDNARRKFGVATRIQLIVKLIREGVLQ